MGNHDRPRVATRMGLEMIDMMNMLLLTLPGTPTCYAGDEIGMENVYYTFNETQDPYGRHYGPMVMCIYIIYLLSTLTCCCFIAPRTLIYLLLTLTCCCFIAPRTLIYLLSTLTCCCFIAPKTLIYLLSTLTCCCFIAPRTLIYCYRHWHAVVLLLPKH